MKSCPEEFNELAWIFWLTFSSATILTALLVGESLHGTEDWHLHRPSPTVPPESQNVIAFTH